MGFTPDLSRGEARGSSEPLGAPCLQMTAPTYATPYPVLLQELHTCTSCSSARPVPSPCMPTSLVHSGGPGWEPAGASLPSFFSQPLLPTCLLGSSSWPGPPEMHGCLCDNRGQCVSSPSRPPASLRSPKAGLGSSSATSPARPVTSAQETPDGGRLPYPFAAP